jgi:hypothetical protein
MLNRKQYLLLCLMEELGEVQKEVSKCLRFGPDHQAHQDDPTNFEKVSLEWNDVLGIIELLKQEELDLKASDIRIEIKKSRTEQYYQKSRELGECS